MQGKKLMAKALAPVANKTAERSDGVWCMFWYHQRKLPQKLMSKVK